MGLPWWLSGKESAYTAGMQVQSLGYEDSLEEEMEPTLVLLPVKSHGQSSQDAKSWT